MKITNTQRVSYPACRFIGRKYLDGDRANNGSFGHKWGEWFQNGWFEPLEKLDALAESGDAYVGLMREADPFEYWIGMFFPAGTEAPEGCEWTDLPAMDYGVCWLYGKEDTGELYGMDAHSRALASIQEKGMAPKPGGYMFELYNCPRFTTPDEQGNVILDYGIEVI
ncbi:MAG: GyrI-like domain-containing protein [Oscillospiraceae bacterium]|jgi:predicted transcriptional regulator YdeE|nr:GyrI-like domain-containing protein [Oscillospiraceae bacterium]